jgi:hypothetical protein
MDDGIHENLPEAEYHADPRDSASRIVSFLRRRTDYRDRKGPEVSDAMRFGSYFHGALLEPHRARDERFAVAPCRLDIGQAKEGDADAFTKVNCQKTDGKKAWSDFEKKLESGKTPVLPQLARCTDPMLAAIARHEEAGPLFFPVDAGRNEVTLAWHDEATGRAMRMRADRIIVDGERCLVPDGKTMDPKFIGNPASAVYKLGYHVKAAVYLDGLLAVTGRIFAMPFVFVTVDTSPQVRVWWASYDDVAVQWGRWQYREALRAIVECERAGDWREPFERRPGQPFELPGWALREARDAFGLTGVGEAPHG